MPFTVLAFLVAISLLIFVHEYGHYRAALWCGVRVERFAIGFGPPLLTWHLKGKTTEFVIGALPIGGYVRMLGHQPGAIAPEDKAYAFNFKPLWARAFIVAAGPIANLLMAVMLYATVNWVGMPDAKPILASVVPGSLAAQAGIKAGDVVEAAALDEQAFEPIGGYSQFAWVVTRATMQKQPLELKLLRPGEVSALTIRLSLDRVDLSDPHANPLQKVGFRGVRMAPELGEISAQSAAYEAGLKTGDLVVSVAGLTVVDAAALRDWIKQQNDPSIGPQPWKILRAGSELTLEVKPKIVDMDGKPQGRIGAAVGGKFEPVMLEYGIMDGLEVAAHRAWEMSLLTLKTMGQMVIGEASVKHLSGPLSIAEHAGKTAEVGLQAYLLFLAVISISLGVLNLLPIPVLDGGHLMYYLWESVAGKPVSDRWQDILQRVGTAVILMLMFVGLFNDISRIF
jgi:regulator of sigma E protease